MIPQKGQKPGSGLKMAKKATIYYRYKAWEKMTEEEFMRIKTTSREEYVSPFTGKLV